MTTQVIYSSDEINFDVSKRYGIVILFDAKDANPNGDPDNGNQPRSDIETGQGLVTDVCLKRKIRNFVQITKANDVGYGIFIKEQAILNNSIDDGVKQSGAIIDNKGKTSTAIETDKAKNFMCKNYFDVRTFGAVMSTGANAGQVTGPIQMTFSRSLDRIVPTEHLITRVVATKVSVGEDKQKEREMGTKHTIPYGLYRGYVFFNPFKAKQTGFSNDDMKTFIQALEHMFTLDRSASKGFMSVKRIFIFEHSTALGATHDDALFDRISINKKDGVDSPRTFDDYNVVVNNNGFEKVGVKLYDFQVGQIPA